ncbi:transglutaminase TgpA family protein, partial [Streptomyces sp. NPDC055078]
MSGRGRLALCAYAATLLAASAMLPLLEGGGWLIEAVLLLAAQSGAGALARRVPLARPMTVAAQVLVTLLLLTLVFARDHALLGVLPGPEAFQRFGELLSVGGEDIGRYAIPAPATEGIRLMVVGGVLVVGLLVDAIAVTFRSAAPAGLPLLALYSVAAGLSRGGAGWLWFLLAASGYLLLLLAEGRDRLSQWGRVFGGAPATPPRGSRAFDPAGGRSPVAPVRAGRRIGVLALGVALAVPAALPSLDGGLLSGVGGGEGSGSGGGTISAVNPVVSLQDNLNQSDNREVLLYNTTAKDTKDLYLRFVALDEFDGKTWKSSERDVRDVPDRLPQPQGLSASVKTTPITTNVSAAEYYEQNWLPLPYPATELKIGGRWRYEPEGRTVVGDRGEDTGGAQYTVSSLLVEPTAEMLASAPPAPPDLQREYTKVPDVLPDVVRETAERVTRGADNDYERAVRLQDWFAVSGGFTYDTHVKSGTGVDAIARFLQQKEGFCIHFSFAMASMARTLGIPARVAVGFTPGSPGSNGGMSVTMRDAHAWPELYFEGAGWTRFEPTPSRGSAPDYTRAETPSGGPTSPAQPEATVSDAPSPTPTVSDSCPAELRRLGECGAPAPQGVDTPTDSGTSAGAALLTGLGVLAAVAVPLLPMLWRFRVRARRLSSGGRSPTDASARALAAWLEISDTAWDHGVLPDDSLTPRRTAARIVRLGNLTGAAADSVHRIAGAVEQVLYAPRPGPAMGLTDDVERIRAGLRAGVSGGTRLRALLLPRSTVRVVWVASAGWESFTGRWHRWGRARWA